MGFYANSFYAADFWHPGFWAGSGGGAVAYQARNIAMFPIGMGLNG